MHTGHYISGAGHLALLGWLALGNVFAAEPLPFEATDVAVISGAEYEAMVAAFRPPESATEVAQPQNPEVTPELPSVPTPTEETSDLEVPSATETPEVETPP